MTLEEEPYLVRLGNRLLAGLERLDNERRERHRSFVLSQQMDDGGFSGREGDSDLYYTGFAVRSLAILGGLNSNDCDRIGSFLQSHDYQSLQVVDLTSWLYSALMVQVFSGLDLFENADPDWAEQIAARLETVRTQDGGYAKSPEGAVGSTYHSFLVALTYELIGQTLPNPGRLTQFVYDRQRDDGGFVEIGPMKRSGTNPTAAAVGLLTMLDAMDEEIRQDVRSFLRDVRSSEGGFQANMRIPFADGLSTFTGLLTSQDLGFDDVLSYEQIEALMTEWLEFPTGGFRGASWDEQADVEYTFYGLGNLGLIWSADSSSQQVNE